MQRFRQFINESVSHMEDHDLQKTLHKIPKAHRELLGGYKFLTQGGNTLKNDSQHIGSNDMAKKCIVIAAPYNYGREFALLHEIGHLVWAKYVLPYAEKKKQWSAIVKKTKNKLHQNNEELFSHAYANTYAKNQIVIHDHPEWDKFVKSLS